jgi:ketosteroid isomerase-like protein
MAHPNDAEGGTVLTKRIETLSVAVVLMGFATAAFGQAPPRSTPPPPTGHAAPPAEAPKPASLPIVTLPAPLARVLTDYETAWHDRDAAALAALFAEDGFVLSSGSPPVRGRAAIEKHYTGAGGPLSLHAFAFGTEGSQGWIIGGFAHHPGTADDGKFTLTLRKGADGRWLINSDMDNGNIRR